MEVIPYILSYPECDKHPDRDAAYWIEGVGACCEECAAFPLRRAGK